MHRISGIFRLKAYLTQIKRDISTLMAEEMTFLSGTERKNQGGG
jgi:hypothetical protein